MKQIHVTIKGNLCLKKVYFFLAIRKVNTVFVQGHFLLFFLQHHIMGGLCKLYIQILKLIIFFFGGGGLSLHLRLFSINITFNTLS